MNILKKVLKEVGLSKTTAYGATDTGMQREENQDKKQLTIGRSDDHDLILNDPEVSTHHATLSWNKDLPMKLPMFFITDHASTNGTYINVMAIEPNVEKLIADQSTIEFGINCLFLFYLPETFYRCITHSK